MRLLPVLNDRVIIQRRHDLCRPMEGDKLRRFSAGLVCAAMAVGLSIPASAVASDDDTIGTLVTAEGKATSTAGGSLTVFQEPSAEELADLPMGESLEYKPIGTASVGANGQVSADADELAVAAGVEPGEAVEVTLAGTVGDQAVSYPTVLDPSDSAADPVSIAPNTARLVEDNSEGLDSGGINPAMACTTTKVGAYNPALARVGATFVHSSGATADYRFTSGATAQLGVGVSASGTKGTFGAGTTRSVGTSVGTDFPTNTWGSKYHQAFVKPEKFRINCFQGQGLPNLISYQMRVTSFTGGNDTNNNGTSFTNNNYCTTIGKGSTTTIDETRATTWNAGLNTAGSIGVNLSSQSGYTQQSMLVLKAGSKSRNMCGRYAYPGEHNQTPGLVKVSN